MSTTATTPLPSSFGKQSYIPVRKRAPKASKVSKIKRRSEQKRPVYKTPQAMRNQRSDAHVRLAIAACASVLEIYPDAHVIQSNGVCFIRRHRTDDDYPGLTDYVVLSDGLASALATWTDARDRLDRQFRLYNLSRKSGDVEHNRALLKLEVSQK
jgi:hypothetical protein